MHILCGNTAAFAPASDSQRFHLCVANTNGLSAEGRWEQVLNRCESFTALIETHCTASMQASLPYVARDFHLHWGAPVRQGSRTGVAALVKQGSLWQTKTISLADTPLDKYYKNGRLLLVQIFYGCGARSMLIYIVYGPAGARWEQHKKDELEEMVSAITLDIAGRGSMPVCVVGDFNIQVSESKLLQTLLNTHQWFDAYQLGCPAEQAKHTLHKANGSRIDFVFTNSLAAGLVETYTVVPGVLPKDHSEVHVAFTLPRNAQFRYVVSQPNEHIPVPYDNTPADYVPPTIDSTTRIRQQLRQNRIDDAFQTWCDLAQDMLHKIPHTLNSRVMYDTGKHRGQVRFQRQCVVPRQRDAHSLNLRSRRIADALGRVQELLRSPCFGQQSLNTWKNLSKVLPSLDTRDQLAFSKFINDSINTDALLSCAQILRQNLQVSQASDKQARIKAWKSKLAQSEKHAYQWLKSPNTPVDITMKLPSGIFTANTESQLEAIHNDWLPIFQKFAQTLPDIKTFEEHFVPFMKTSPMALSPLTGPELVQTLASSKNSSPSLDGWSPQSLIALSKWFPCLYDGLADILNWIEEHSIWPTPLCKAYTALIPKDGMSDSPKPVDFRPISVLSAIYRLWAKARFNLSLEWQEQWCHKEVWGCRKQRGAEAMCLQIALHLEKCAVEQQSAAGGVAYDFRKAFDLVPFELLFSALVARGMHPRIVNPLKAIYSSLHRVFRLRGSCGHWWFANNGLLQGCPLSMIGLNAVVSCILEIASIQCPEVVARTYADDVSASCVSSTTADLTRSIAKFDRIVRALEEIRFGEIATKKSFTFGHPCLKRKIHVDFPHLQRFKIVGGSFVTEHQQANASEVEKGRFAKWHKTVIRLRHCPLPWRDKSKMLLATSSQATYGQGTHSCGIDEPTLTRIRSSIMRAMFSLDFYSHNTHLSFAILLPAQLDPLFSHTYQGLRTLARCLNNPTFRRDFQHLLRAKSSRNFDGPVSRVQRILKGPFQALVKQLINDQVLNIELWAHQLRDCWRAELLQKAAKNRPQHFHDVTNLDFRRTLLLYKKLDHLALMTADEQIFMQQGVLRRLLVGGLMTEERDARHRKDLQSVQCPCGGDPTVLHISWSCPLFADLRKPIQHIDFRTLPTCTQYAALIPQHLNMPDQQVLILQQTLVNIWRQYIQDFKSGQRSETARTAQSSEAAPIDQNGHVLKPRPNNQPGVFCCKCGKFVARSKHIRLKITSQPCAQRDSPIILEKEGFNQSEKRLDDAFQKLLTDYNATSKHTLEWNRKLGKVVGREDEGKINCTACGHTWPWKDRNNIRRTICRQTPQPRPSKPISPAPSAQKPLLRLRCKTRPSEMAKPPSLDYIIPVHENASASSSTDARPSGHPNDDVVRRKGVG